MQRSLTTQAARNDNCIGTRSSRKIFPFPTRYGVVTQDAGLCLRGNLHRANHGGGRETAIRDKDEIDRSDSRRNCFPLRSGIQRRLSGTDRIRDPDRGETFYPEFSCENPGRDKLCHRYGGHESDSVASNAELRSQLSQVASWIWKVPIHAGVRVNLMIDDV